MWTVGYLVGSVSALGGVLRGDARFEGAGIVLLGASVFTNGLAILTTFGLAGVWTIVNFLVILVILVDRLWQLTHVTRRANGGS